MSEPNYYEVLGVPAAATADEIKRAYRSRARLLHPDRSSTSAAEMSQVNEAYRVLRDPVRRARYDGGGSSTDAGPPLGPPPVLRLREPAHPLAHPRAPWIVLGTLIVAAIAVVLLAAGNRDGGGGGPAVDGVVGPGSCVITAPGRAEVAEVACAEPHDGVALAVVGFDETCPTGTEFFVNPAATRRVCVRLGDANAANG